MLSKQKINPPTGPAVSSHEPVPIEIKKKVADRAKKICEYPKCKEKNRLEFHHKNLKNNDNSASNIELLCPKHHKIRHINKIRKKIGYDIVTGQKITRPTKMPKKKITQRKKFTKSKSKPRSLHKNTSKKLLNKTLNDL